MLLFFIVGNNVQKIGAFGMLLKAVQFIYLLIFEQEHNRCQSLHWVQKCSFGKARKTMNVIKIEDVENFHIVTLQCVRVSACAMASTVCDAGGLPKRG